MNKCTNCNNTVEFDGLCADCVTGFALKQQPAPAPNANPHIVDKDAELTRLRARCERLEAVAAAAQRFRDETNGLLRAALGAQRPALKATTYQEICAALAALDQQPQQGQEVSK